MEETILNHQSRNRQSSIPLHHSSHSISKLKPKIRVVHLIAPEVIKTDVTNFRDLVQKLTGKPSTNKKRSKCSANSNPKTKVHQEDESHEKVIKEEEQFVKCEDPWMNMEGSSSGGYLSYLEEEEGEVEGFFQPSFIGDLSSLFHVSS
ncbi:VQ motif-containing protein [Rhynchospora pubera]|uniref:VQ motif-containing protein n=1 Tax=Rhynchospora pubera TaxID=906938 RepID=A0AAV8BY72_9POAL|nr:VQ motif-containing protein [Rhynchospora pubera]